ncbi:MAG: peroxide stress protein YaaA [Maricaulaceae bacterium]
MLVVLSPAKNMNFDAMDAAPKTTQPRLMDQVRALSKVTRALSRADLRAMMDISEALADLNYERFQSFDPDQPGLKAAALAFNGDVYQGLQANTFNGDDFAFAQDHLRILSGFYGVLRPLEAIQPYRLEMGRKLKTDRGEDLYDFWGARIAETLNADFGDEPAPTLINLASNEYFSAVDKKALKATIITPAFKDVKNGKARVLSFYAKWARGAMARHIVKNRITEPDGLKSFTEGGYRFDESLSKGSAWVFTRPQPAKKAA